MRVSVSGRSRVITLSNRGDVIQTIQDLIDAGKQDPLTYYRDVTSFSIAYNLRVLRLINTAEAEGGSVVKSADAAGLVREEAQQLMRRLRPELDSAWRRARREQQL